jgi:hypothetical protein
MIHTVKTWIRYALMLALCALAMVRALPAVADDASNPFTDVSPSDPAFQAIVRLHDAGYLQGYPDGYFHGKRPITRYEMAVLVDRVVAELEFQLDNPGGAMKVTQRSVADAKLLLDQYGSDIKDLKAKTAALDKTVTALQATADRTQIHLYAYLRAPGTYTESVNAVGPTGTPFKDNTPVTDGVSTYNQGTNARGTGVEVIRMIISGNIDKQSSYAMRLENKNYLGQVNVIGLDTVNPTPAAYQNQSLLRLNYAYLKYQFKNSPLYLVGGKFPASADLGLTFANDYFDGGYAGVNGKLNGFVGFGQQGGPDLGSTAPFAYVPTGTATSGSLPHTQFAIMSHWGYSVTPQLTVGANMLDLSALPQKIWSASANNFLAFNQPLASGSLAATYKASPTLTLAVEGLERFGKDPTTQSAWADRRAVWFQGLVGNSTAADGNTYGEVGFAGTGYNSVINANTGLNGTPFYTYYYTGQANDRRLTYGSLYHYVGNNLRLGVTYLNWGLNVPEPLVPSSSIPAGSTLQTNSNRALFLSTQVQF